ncbi:RNA polymerase II [Gongronella butleri]|nr:RNA polymerase II [Gongronella butleri]
MIIKNARAALISNYEVLSLLRERRDYQKHMEKHAQIEYPERLRTIQFELAGYLEKTPASTQTPENIKQLLDALVEFDLTLGEKLHIINHRPISAVEVYLLIEECEERLSEEDTQRLVEIVETYLPEYSNGIQYMEEDNA